MKIFFPLLFLLLLLNSTIVVKSQVINDLAPIVWTYGNSYTLYGHTIVPISGTLSDNKWVDNSYTNIAYRNLKQLNADIKVTANQEHWDSLKIKNEIDNLNKTAIGGRIYIYIMRNNRFLDNSNYFSYKLLIKDMDEKEIYSTSSKFSNTPTFKNKNDYKTNDFNSRYFNGFVSFDIDKEVPDSFYVYFNELNGQLNTFKFKIIPLPKMKKYISFYANNQVFVKGILENNLQIGTWIIYHPNGKIGVIENYIDGKLNGKVIEYFDDGALAAEKEYKNGIKNGVWKQYYYKIIIDGRYKEDKKDSIWNFYDTIGNLTATGPFLNDLKNGKWTYYVDKHPESEGNYLDDLENGEWFIYNT